MAATKKTIDPAKNEDGTFSNKEWDKIAANFQGLKAVAQTPYNARTTGGKTMYDELFIGAKVALDARLKEDADLYHNPLILAKQKTGRMAVALQQAQYMSLERKMA